MPVAYYLTDGTRGKVQAQMLLKVITKLREGECLAISVTMDGLTANQKTLQVLGCYMDPDNLVSVFLHPTCK